MENRGHLMTELRNPRSANIDRMSVREAVALLNAEDATVAQAVADAGDDIARAIDLVIAAFERGGRLIYVGAGTSGRLGVLDASECPPTFLSEPEMVQGVIAGGWEALRRAIEGAEDFPEDGAVKMDEMEIGPNDVVMGISTGGTTPYVHGALSRAKERGANTVFFGCITHEQFADGADVSIRVLVGPEVITGSTRLKAGTATKMVLNMITTISMVQIGKVYENLMVDVDTTRNRKLVDRGERIIMALTGVERPQAAQLLKDSRGRVKIALVMHERGVSRDEAEQLLAAHRGHVTPILKPE